LFKNLAYRFFKAESRSIALLAGTLPIPLQRRTARHRPHHACGAAANYAGLGSVFPDGIEAWLIELPGRA
jgi:hypothetical protein